MLKAMIDEETSPDNSAQITSINYHMQLTGGDPVCQHELFQFRWNSQFKHVKSCRREPFEINVSHESNSCFLLNKIETAFKVMSKSFNKPHEKNHTKWTG